jgi:hypothetical protein
MISDMLVKMSDAWASAGATEDRLRTQLAAAMAVIEAMREWAAHPTGVNVQALRAAESRLDEVLKG